MKKISLLPLILFLAGSHVVWADDYTGWKDNGYNWQLTFSDEFDGSSLNTDNWSRLPYSNDYIDAYKTTGEYNIPDWRKNQSTAEGLVEVGNGSLTLWGKYGEYSNQSTYTSNQVEAYDKGTLDTTPYDTLAATAVNQYASGAIWSRNTFTLQYGYVEVKARFDCAAGVWPAIWLLPVNGAGWPKNGEIDIMEHLAQQGGVHQTLHFPSNSNPSADISGVTINKDFASLNGTTKDDWHTYGMEWTDGQISFYVDGILTTTFTKDNYTYWPFDNEGNEFYLIIDQQLGGSWVEGLPAGPLTANGLGNGKAFEIDYVHVYSQEFLPEPATITLSLLAGMALVMRRRRA